MDEEFNSRDGLEKGKFAYSHPAAATPEALRLVGLGTSRDDSTIAGNILEARFPLTP